MSATNSVSRPSSIHHRLKADTHGSTDEYISPPIKSGKEAGGESSGETDSGGKQNSDESSFAQYQSPWLTKPIINNAFNVKDEPDTSGIVDTPSSVGNSTDAEASKFDTTTAALSESENAEVSSAVVGVSGAVGREQVVQGILDRSYQAGYLAPQGSYNGSIHRGVPTEYADSALGYGHNPASGQRYDAPQQKNGIEHDAIYGGPTRENVRRELEVYDAPEGGRTYIEFKANINIDPTTGKGGIANIDGGMRQQGLPRSVFTQSTNIEASSKGADTLHWLTGEHRYSAPQQAAKGAVDAGAVAIRAPSAAVPGGSQINVLPSNAAPDTLTPVTSRQLPKGGTLGPLQDARSVVNPLQPSTKSSVVGSVPDHASSSQRASSMRYGAAGAFGDTLVQAGRDAINGQEIKAGELAEDLSLNTGLATGVALVTDKLAPKFGAAKAGGAIGALVQAGLSGHTNYQDYEAGKISGERAIANTVVDTGTAVAAGATGAVIGAGIGSAVPIAGTAAGAVVGFVAGVGTHYAIQAVDSVTGFTAAAKESLTNGLNSATKWVSSLW